jgi:hypothetical protein
MPPNKYCTPVNLFLYSQKSHFCQRVACFGLEAKTEGDNNCKLVILGEKKAPVKIINKYLDMLVIIGCAGHYFYLTVLKTRYQKIHCCFKGQTLRKDSSFPRLRPSSTWSCPSANSTAFLLVS